MKSNIIALIFLFIITTDIISQQYDMGIHFDQNPPGMTPEIFAPGILSTEENVEQEPVFSSDGKMLFYTTRFEEEEYVTMYMIREKETWSDPLGPLYIDGLKVRYPSVSHDSKKLFFVYVQEIEKNNKKSFNSDIYFAKIVSPGHFGKPEKMNPIINSEYNENHPSIADSGNLYFYSDIEAGFGGADIYRSVMVDGNYTAAENLGENVNSQSNEFNPFIAADESYIIFNSMNSGKSNAKPPNSDLFISFRNEDGSWSKAKNMGSAINSEASELKATVSPDGRF
ncbi:hypothetical protein ACFLTH_15460, partial [Bacteroidota bacterium]